MEPANDPSEPPLAYAGPSADRPIEVRAPGEILKWIYVVLFALTVITWIAFFLTADTLPWILWTIGNDVCRTSMVAIGVLWVYQSWNGVPAWQRGARTPARMAIQLLVPLYGIYWTFVVHRELCRALDRALVLAGDSRRAPRVLATLAPGVYFGVDAFGIIMRFDWRSNWFMYALCACSYAVWSVYAFRCDRARWAVVEVAGRTLPGEMRSAHVGSRAGLSVRMSVALLIATLAAMAALQAFGPDTMRPL